MTGRGIPMFNRFFAYCSQLAKRRQNGNVCQGAEKGLKFPLFSKSII